MDIRNCRRQESASYISSREAQRSWFTLDVIHKSLNNPGPNKCLLIIDEDD
jgi:hypothetical protein